MFASVLFLIGSLVLAPAVAVADIVPLTAAAGCDSFAPSINGDGSLAAFESDCDLTGGNADGNREIFRSDAAGAITQLTDTTGCTNVSPSSNSAGDRISYLSDCDLTGANADGNFELFQSRAGSTFQLTDSAGCDSFAPSSNLDGTRIFFDSDCDFTGANTDRSNEIFRVSDQGSVVQYTDDRSSSFCGSFAPTSNGSGKRVAFESDCDLSGDNPDQFMEIFRADNLGAVTRLTFSDDTCTNSSPSISDVGLLVAFESDCDPTGGNSDGSLEVFTVDSAGSITQLTDDSGVSGCASVAPSVNGDGTVVAFAGYCDASGGNGDGSFEVFLADPSGIMQVTDGSSCASQGPSVSEDGGRIGFEGTCDPVGGNADGSSEIFLSRDCFCGAPSSRGNGPGGLPTASDALFVLRSAVGQMTCAPCDCDVNSSSTITSSDALVVLQAAVGQSVPLTCP